MDAVDTSSIKKSHKSMDADYVKNYNRVYYEKTKAVRKEIKDSQNFTFTCSCSKYVKSNSLLYHNGTAYHNH